MDIKVLENDDVSCIFLAAGRVHWQVTVNVVTNAGLTEFLLASQTEFQSMVYFFGKCFTECSLV